MGAKCSRSVLTLWCHKLKRKAVKIRLSLQRCNLWWLRFHYPHLFLNTVFLFIISGLHTCIQGIMIILNPLTVLPTPLSSVCSSPFHIFLYSPLSTISATYACTGVGIHWSVLHQPGATPLRKRWLSLFQQPRAGSCGLFHHPCWNVDQLGHLQVSGRQPQLNKWT